MTTVEIDALMQILGPMGIAGVLVWYLYYNTAVALPRLQDTTLARIDAMQTRHADTIKQVCSDFTQTIRDERIVRREEITMLRNELRQREEGKKA